MNVGWVGEGCPAALGDFLDPREKPGFCDVDDSDGPLRLFPRERLRQHLLRRLLPSTVPTPPYSIIASFRTARWGVSARLLSNDPF